MLLVAGNFNIPLIEFAPYICTPNKKFIKIPQCDKIIVQDIIVKFKLFVPHCKQTLRYIFIYEIYASCIDYIFVQEYQIR